MKKHLLIFTAALALLTLPGCDDGTTNQPTDYDIVYGLRQVMQYDPANVNGINVCDKFDFFETLRFTIHYTESKISAVTFASNDVPFSPFSFTPPNGKVDAFLDTDCSPHVLRIRDTGDAIADFINGEFSITFQLDSPLLKYKYTFKSVK